MVIPSHFLDIDHTYGSSDRMNHSCWIMSSWPHSLFLHLCIFTVARARSWKDTVLPGVILLPHFGHVGTILFHLHLLDFRDFLVPCNSSRHNDSSVYRDWLPCTVQGKLFEHVFFHIVHTMLILFRYTINPCISHSYIPICINEIYENIISH